MLWKKNHLSPEELNRLLDGELDEARKLFAENHLQQCESCALEYADLRRVVRSMDEYASGLTSESDASSVWPRIEDAIRRKSPVHLSWKERFGVSFPVFVMRPALALSVIAFLMVFTFFVFERRTLADNEAIVNSVSSENKLVMIFKTKERKITVIWLAEMPELEMAPPVEPASAPAVRAAQSAPAEKQINSF